MTENELSAEPSAYVRSLPIGKPLPLAEDGVVSWAQFPLEGDMRVKVLAEPELPEAPRMGEDGPEGCHACRREVTDPKVLWADEHWMVCGFDEPEALPAAVMLYSRGHYDLADLPPERSAELGPMIQRVERAVISLGGIARVHVNRWGDGAAHFHLWFLARPEGMTQLKGTFLPLWGDVMPKVEPEVWAETNRRIAAALAAES
ncbi:hypothetical protein OG455_35105 [Kitasatospora sp. NBC_01287]|uniref:HIT family protein n=1 Tax=Kitasatospora sp. NBC_01287 TaxID=2903573 RepID=UPI002254E6DA|nr:hypothetical protein [Kitasatospora sp. NBC_01287]MCX4750674.1 hypothetical protein [Kitasatospora sp. NBC_01287]